MADSFSELTSDSRTALALELARAAARIVVPAFFGDGGEVSAADKNAGATDASFDPVTAADRAAERVMREMINRAFPADAIIGEEFGPGGSDAAEWQWLLDPIDGTRAFLCGLPGFTTLIALLHDGAPVLGLINDPLLDTTTIGNGTHCWRLRGSDVRHVRVSATIHLGDALAGTTLPRLYDTPGKRAFLDAVQQRARHVQFDGDASFYAALAQGRMDIAFDTGLKPFDAAALIPVVRGAGGIISGWHGETAAPGGDIIACATPALHEQMLALLEETGAAAESGSARTASSATAEFSAATNPSSTASSAAPSSAVED